MVGLAGGNGMPSAGVVGRELARADPFCPHEVLLLGAGTIPEGRATPACWGITSKSRHEPSGGTEGSDANLGTAVEGLLIESTSPARTEASVLAAMAVLQLLLLLLEPGLSVERAAAEAFRRTRSRRCLSSSRIGVGTGLGLRLGLPTRPGLGGRKQDSSRLMAKPEVGDN